MTASHGRAWTIAAVGVCLLVVLSGCSALTGGDDGGDGGGTTADPGGDGGGDGVPGVSDGELTDHEALLAAHRDELAAAGFVFTFEHVQTDYEVLEGGDKQMLERRIDATGEVRATADLAAHRRRVDRAAPEAKLTVRWTNGTAGARRIERNGTRYELYRESPSPRLTHHYLVPQLLARGNWDVDSRTDDRVVLTTAVSPEHGDLIRFEGRLVVDDSGRIHRLAVNVTTSDIRHRGQETYQTHTVRRFVYDVQQVGNVSVAPPDWLAEARAATDDDEG